MKKFTIIIALTLLLGACNEGTNGHEKINLETQDISENVQEKEPTDPKETEVWQPTRAIVNPYGKKGVPSDAIILFDGSNLEEWISARDSTAVQWVLNGDGSMTVKDKTGDIQTKRNFGSVQLHLEWRSSPENNAQGQARGNSGVYLQNRYEIQVLDNNDNPTYINGQAASLYKQSPPLVQALVPTGEWNNYDIIFSAPEFNEDGEKTKAGTITILHNGVLVQDHFEIEGTSEYIGWPKNNAHGPAPIKLQDHGDNSRVSYRNIWIREL
jgi:3-keto-disaccharide hydrolase